MKIFLLAALLMAQRPDDLPPMKVQIVSVRFAEAFGHRSATGYGNLSTDRMVNGFQFTAQDCPAFQPMSGYQAKWEGRGSLVIQIRRQGTEAYTPCVLRAQIKSYAFAVQGGRVVKQPLGEP